MTRLFTRRRALLGGMACAAGWLGAKLPKPAQAEPLFAPSELMREVELYRAENILLHRKVDLRGLRRLRDGRPVPGDTPPPLARLLLVHLWAVECHPCVEEFPILRRITDSLYDLPQLKAVLVTETLDESALQLFFTTHRSDLPRVEHYQSSDDRLRRSLQNRTQPLTLFLDALGIVRQAFLGSLKQRRSEFADALLRLSRSI